MIWSTLEYWERRLMIGLVIYIALNYWWLW